MKNQTENTNLFLSSSESCKVTGILGQCNCTTSVINVTVEDRFHRNTVATENSNIFIPSQKILIYK